MISSVNVTKCDLVTFTEEILNGKLHFFTVSAFNKFNVFQIAGLEKWIKIEAIYDKEK